MEQVLYALSGVIIGSTLTGTINYFLKKLEFKKNEEKEIRQIKLAKLEKALSLIGNLRRLSIIMDISKEDSKPEIFSSQMIDLTNMYHSLIIIIKIYLPESIEVANKIWDEFDKHIFDKGLKVLNVDDSKLVELIEKEIDKLLNTSDMKIAKTIT